MSTAADRAALEDHRQIEVIVECKQDSATPSPEALSRQKAQIFAAVAADSIVMQRDFTHLPMAVVTLRSADALQALLAQPGVRAVYSNTQSRATNR